VLAAEGTSPVPPRSTVQKLLRRLALHPGWAPWPWWPWLAGRGWPSAWIPRDWAPWIEIGVSGSGSAWQPCWRLLPKPWVMHKPGVSALRLAPVAGVGGTAPSRPCSRCFETPGRLPAELLGLPRPLTPLVPGPQPGARTLIESNRRGPLMPVNANILGRVFSLARTPGARVDGARSGMVTLPLDAASPR